MHKTLPFCFCPILITSCLRRKDTRLSARYIFGFRGSLGTRLLFVCVRNKPILCQHIHVFPPPPPYTHHTYHVHATHTNSAIFKRQSSRSVRVSEKPRAKIFPHVRHLVEKDRKRILVSHEPLCAAQPLSTVCVCVI